MKAHVIAWLTPMVGPEAARMLAPGWFTCAALAGLVCALLTIRRARRAGLDVATVATALMAAYVAALAGGILGPMIWAAGEAALAGRGMRIGWAGMTSYCGFLAAFAVIALVVRRAGTLSLGRFCDLVAVPAAASLVVARLGCFLAGCDYGAVSSAPWALRFPAGSPAFRDHVARGWLAPTREASLPVHPAQLYEAALGVALIVLALVVARTAWARRGEGRVFGAVVAGYALGRLAVEAVRGDVGRGLFGPVSAGQLVCAALLVYLAVRVLRARVRPVLVAAVALVLVIGHGVDAHAQPADAAGEPGASRTYRAAGMLGTATALNRRDGQVPVLSGAALAGAVTVAPRVWLGLDLASMSNTVANHGSLIATGGFGVPASRTLSVGAALGLGWTLVDFHDAGFVDVTAPTVRFGPEVEWLFSRRLSLLVHPATVDVIASRELGGPILTYQLRLGLAYRFGGAPAATPAASSGPPGQHASR